jgi:oligopeptidase B
LALRRRRAGSAPAGEIAFPEPAYSAHPHINRIFETPTFRYGYQSLVTPSSVYEYDVATGASTLLKQLEIPGGFDRTLYASERVHATAPDGVQVPVSLVYRKDKRKPGAESPVRLRLRLLWLLAAAGLQLQPAEPARSRRGDGLCAHSRRRRPGRALARRRQDAGQAQHLHGFHRLRRAPDRGGYGDPARVAIEGGSAGGLLMGAVVNLRPDLFRAVLSHVPFVDVMNTMLDASLPLTVPEYEEWGNPNEAEFFTIC